MRINLTLLGACACAALCAGPALAAPVFYCDAKTGRERAEEIRVIRTEYLPGLKEIVEGPPGLGDRAHAVEEFKEWTARLAELELGVKSCKELREFERPKPEPKPSMTYEELMRSDPPPSMTFEELMRSDRPAPQQPNDDVLVPPNANDGDDVLVPPKFDPLAAPKS